MASNELSRSTLLRKDRDELVTIASAMGGKPGSRTRKAQVVDMILELAGVDADEGSDDASTVPVSKAGDSDSPEAGGDASTPDSEAGGDANAPDSEAGGDANAPESDAGSDDAPADESAQVNNGDDNNGGEDNGEDDDGNAADTRSKTGDDSDEGGNRRRRRRRGRDRDSDPVDTEPVDIDGYLDLRDDGYGFIRVSGGRPTKRDVYVSVKQVRQNGLRKGDHVAGQARPANRNEKNPALVEVSSVNGGGSDVARDRPNFDDLTPVHPRERFTIERADDPTARAVDLLAPLGKGQRGLVVSPPRAGKTAMLKSICTSIAQNHPECNMILVLIDERPEEVTELEQAVDGAEILASTFDRPAEEHVLVAEMAVERAKRMAEAGHDVVVIIDGISRLARAQNLSGAGTGRTIAGGIEAAAIYQPKRLFGAARCLDEGGSLTMIATTAVETGSRLDELILDEMVGAANAEIRLDRELAERRVQPALDVIATATRHDDQLIDEAQQAQVSRLRGVLRAEGEGATEALLERISATKTNADLLKRVDVD